MQLISPDMQLISPSQLARGRMSWLGLGGQRTWQSHGLVLGRFTELLGLAGSASPQERGRRRPWSATCSFPSAHAFFACAGEWDLGNERARMCGKRDRVSDPQEWTRGVARVQWRRASMTRWSMVMRGRKKVRCGFPKRARGTKDPQKKKN